MVDSVPPRVVRHRRLEVAFPDLSSREILSYIARLRDPAKANVVAETRAFLMEVADPDVADSEEGEFVVSDFRRREVAAC